MRQTVGVRVFRCFAFVDMCGFTRMNDTLGDEEAVAVLAAFRALVRQLAPDHGIRVGKWRGDGACSSSTETRPIVAGMLDLVEQLESADIVLPLRIGIAVGQGDPVRRRRLHRHGDQPRVAPVRRGGPRRDPRHRARSWREVGDEFEAVPLGDRAIPGLVAPIEVWRIAIAERDDDDLPSAFVE